MVYHNKLRDIYMDYQKFRDLSENEQMYLVTIAKFA